MVRKNVPRDIRILCLEGMNSFVLEWDVGVVERGVDGFGSDCDVVKSVPRHVRLFCL
jgi:hypothetical protein